MDFVRLRMDVAVPDDEVICQAQIDRIEELIEHEFPQWNVVVM